MSEITLKIQIPEHLENLILKALSSIQGNTTTGPVEDPDELLDFGGMCALLGIKESRGYSLTMRTGKKDIPRYKIGRHLKFKKSEVMEWFDRQKAV